MFPKLSGLYGIVVKDLTVKSDKNFIIINCEESMKSLIKPKEIVMFDLDLIENWIEVEMIIESDEKNCLFSVEIKVRVDLLIIRLKDILIKMGIKHWIRERGEDKNNIEYYLFSSFSLNHTDGRKIEFSNIYRIYLILFH